MSPTYLIALGIVFIATFSIVMLVMYLFSSDPIRERMHIILGDGKATPTKQDGTWIAKVAKLTSPLAKLSLPKEGWDQSHLRIRFMNAGYRGEHSLVIYFGCKTLLAIILPLFLWVFLVFSGVELRTHSAMFALLSISAVGLYLPNFVLSRKISSRQLTIFESFPDALDLMTICIEAGLAIDAAIARVSSEMVDVAPELSEELYLVTLELRAGSSKERALRNLAMRIGVEEVDTLVAMLIQTERFGTSLADSLRIHADSLRVKRRQRAEEAAAKIPLKLLFPLIFCIFPALMVTIAGPAIIQITKTLLPTIAGGS